jgi:hypothetical protein
LRALRHQDDRAARSGRGELDNPEVVGELRVGVDLEADLLGVELLRPLHVGDGNDDHLERHVHSAQILSGGVA